MNYESCSLLFSCGGSVRLNEYDSGVLLSASSKQDILFTVVCILNADPLLCPRPGGIKRWCCLTSVAYIWSVGGVCGRPAGWAILADWARVGQPGPRLPLRTSVAGLGGGISWRPPAYSLF